MTGVGHYVPSMRRRNGLANIFDGHNPSSQQKLQDIYIGNMEARAAFAGGLDECLKTLPSRRIEEEEEVVGSARFKQRRNAVVSAEMDAIEGLQWKQHISELMGALPDVKQQPQQQQQQQQPQEQKQQQQPQATAQLVQ